MEPERQQELEEQENELHSELIELMTEIIYHEEQE